MDGSHSTTQYDDDDVFAHCANPLWLTGGPYTSAQHEIDHHNFNAANNMASLPAPITQVGTFTRLLTQENQYPDVPDPWPIPAQALFDASPVAYQPVGDPDWTQIFPFATDLVAATFSEGMSPNDPLISPTSVEEWAWFSEPGQSTCTTPSSSYGCGGEASWVAPEYGTDTFESTTSPAEWTSELSCPIPATTSVPTVALGKRPREAEEPHDDGSRVDIRQIPPKKRVRSGGASIGILEAAQSTATTRHEPMAKRIPNSSISDKPKSAGRGAERLATPSAQGLYHQPLLGPLQQGWVEEAANGTPIRVEGRVDETVVHQQQQEEERLSRNVKKLEPMQEALLDVTKYASGVDIKCLLCPQTHLKSLQEFKRHCNTVEAHPLEIAFCDDCGDFFARSDSLRRHQNNRPPECKSPTEETKEETERRREKAKKKCRETQIAHEDFLRGLEERLKTGNVKGVVPFSKIIKDKYPESSKKRRAGYGK